MGRGRGRFPILPHQLLTMECWRCHQHNPEGRRLCWNCGAELGASPGAPGDGEPEPQPGAQEPAVPDEVVELGTLGPLRLEGRPEAKGRPLSRIPPGHEQTARSASRFLVRGIAAGALTGGAALGAVFGLLASTAGGLLQASGVSPGALFVLIAQGFMMGAVNGAIIGALSAYYGGGVYTGAIVGGALAAGMWLVQGLLTATVLVAPARMVAATLVLAVAGAAIGALVGAVVESLLPRAD